MWMMVVTVTLLLAGGGQEVFEQEFHGFSEAGCADKALETARQQNDIPKSMIPEKFRIGDGAYPPVTVKTQCMGSHQSRR